MRRAALAIHPLTPNRWDDFEALFGKNGACAGCWCTWWRMSQSEWLAKEGDGTKRKMRALVEKGPPPGLLAYAGDEAVGWCALAPREGYPRLSRSKIPAAVVPTHRSQEGGGAMTRRNISSGSPWEETVGYSRAVRVGNLIEVAGTTAVNERGEVVGANDPYLQAKYALEKIGRALAEAGAGFENVIRTRMFVTDIARWEEVGRAHGEVFRAIRPAATLVQVASLVRSDLLVEIEATAVAPEEST